MKRTLAAVCTFLALIGTSLHAAEMKVALVDMQEVFNQYYKKDEAEKRFKEDVARYKGEIDEKREDYKKIIDQISALQEAANDGTKSEDAKKDVLAKLKEKAMEAKQREQEMNAQMQQTSKFLQDQQLRVRKSLLDEINKAIETFAKGKYNMVFDKSGMTMNGTPALVYSEGMTDITGEIVKVLNTTKPAGN